VTPLTKTVQRGNEILGGTRGAVNPRPKTYKGSFSQQEVQNLQIRLKEIRKDRGKRLLKDPTLDELNIIDALQKQGIIVPEYKPAIGPRASADVMIKPIYILTDKIA
jgi:hypothetical protein